MNAHIHIFIIWAKRFRSCQVYWALFSVVAVSYKFPIREKQFISAIREYTYEGSASPRFFSNANVSGFRSFDTASFQDVIYTLERFLTSGSHILFLRSFQQFTNFFFFSVIKKKKRNFSPFINFAKIEVIFRFIEV